VARTAARGQLALYGGPPVHRRRWPLWPRADAGTEQAVREVLYSGRWAISGQHNGTETFEHRFSRAFADFNGVRFCVPTSSGSAALAIALRALGVGYGDEVLVPGLTWVGCAASVLAVGGVPVFVDVLPGTLAISPTAASASITDRTAAMLVVHPYCTLADLDAFVALSDTTGVALLEDCSQAHGAVWRDRRVGTYGAIGVFSMQESKVLTCGEGGAAITDDEGYCDLMEQLRADGRRYRKAPEVGLPDLEEVGAIQGHNFCLSEIHAAILLDRLGHLDEELALRGQRAAYLRTQLEGVAGVTPLDAPEPARLLSYWRFTIRLDLQEFGGWDVSQISAALSAELGIQVKPVDPPIVNSPLYKPLLSSIASVPLRRRLDPARFDVPGAREAHETCVRIPHRVLLAGCEDMDEIAAAFEKIRRHARRTAR
jgi:dTDP-4-amino-4,6-dideoxygalactose transaminase